MIELLSFILAVLASRTDISGRTPASIIVFKNRFMSHSWPRPFQHQEAEGAERKQKSVQMNVVLPKITVSHEKAPDEAGAFTLAFRLNQ